MSVQQILTRKQEGISDRISEQRMSNHQLFGAWTSLATINLQQYWDEVAVMVMILGGVAINSSQQDLV